jgi:hypothetical protein
MKSTRILAAGFLTTAALCGSAQGRSISINTWGPPSSGGSGAESGPFAGSSAIVDLSNPALSYLTSAGITSLSFAPGLSDTESTTLGGYVIATENSTSDPVEYAWGGNGFAGAAEQVIISSGAQAGTVNISFDYGSGFGSASETASFTVDGTTFTTKVAPVDALKEQIGYSDAAVISSPQTDLCTVASCITLGFQNGALTYSSEFLSQDWTVTPAGAGTLAAPEIDPAGAGGAFTLLGGALAILMSRRCGATERRIALTPAAR